MDLNTTGAIPRASAIQALFRDAHLSKSGAASEAINAVILINQAGTILRVNEQALLLFGCNENEVVGAFYGLFFSMLDVDCASHDESMNADPIFRCLFQGSPCFSISGLARSFDGAVRAIDGSVAPLYEENCEISGAVVICRSLDGDPQSSGGRT